MNLDTPTTDICTPKCLVLLATRNGAEYISQQLESILSQRGVEVRIAIADDTSTDNTIQIADSMRTRGDICIQRRSVSTGSAAQNFIQLIRDIDASNFDYVALSDQDDIWTHEKLQRAVKLLSVTDAGGYSSSVTARWPDGSAVLLTQSARLRRADFLFEGAGQGCTFVLTRDFCKQVQSIFRRYTELSDSLIYHDWAIYAFARALGVAWTFDAKPFMVYRQHGHNDTGARWSLPGLSKRLRMFRTGEYQLQVRTIASLCSTLSPANTEVRSWLRLDKARLRLASRVRKAVFCLRHGRRKPVDRILTSVAALCGWV